MSGTVTPDAAQNRVMVNAMTVDVEDFFQVSAFEPYISRNSWKNYAGRVEENTDRILTLFAEHNVRCTFFTLGWVAEKYPVLIKRIVDQGHDLASHGWDHKRVTTLTRQEFAEDIRKAKAVLEDVSVTAVTGYRAPSYSFTLQNEWAHSVLAEEGYLYSSSVVPIKHDLYGIPGAPRFAHHCANDKILELPVTTTRLFQKNYPCGGGGWFRLYPYQVSRWAINRVNHTDRESAIFYFHPWEIDPDQPRIGGTDFRTRFRHYQNLQKMESKVRRLLTDFTWGAIPDVYQHKLSSLN